MAEAFDDSADFELLPASAAEVIDVDRQLDAAEASALDEPLAAVTVAPPVIPFGRTAPFDFATGRFVRLGDGAIPWVRGKSALREWVGVVLHTGRGGCPLYSDEFGFERLEDYLGDVDPSEQMATLEERLRDSILVHDRVQDLDDYEAEFDPKRGVVELTDFTIITDEAEAVVLGRFDATGGT